jgi:hypothetical protein
MIRSNILALTIVLLVVPAEMPLADLSGSLEELAKDKDIEPKQSSSQLTNPATEVRTDSAALRQEERAQRIEKMRRRVGELEQMTRTDAPPYHVRNDDI